MKKQKLDLQRKLKDEGEKFTRFKDDRYKDILLARKQKCTTDAQLRQIRNKNNKMEFKLKKQEDEISKLKQDQKLAQKRAGK
jgi:kinesin family protein 4/21/27